MLALKVGYATITVVGVSPIDASDQALDGFYSHRKHHIGIRVGLPPAEQARVLMHEMLHACFDAYDLKGEKLDEETVCEMLDGPLTALLTDNPWLVGTLHQAVSFGGLIVE